MLVAPSHCSGYFKVHAKFFQSPYILYDTLSPPNIWICCKNCVLLKHLETHPGILVSPGAYNVQDMKAKKNKNRPSTNLLNPKIIENIFVVSVYRLLASSAILWL